MSKSESIGRPMKLADNLNYSQEGLIHGNLQYVPAFPNQYGAPIPLTTGQTPTVFNIPSDVYNLSESILMYEVNLPVNNAGNYTWFVSDTYAEISHIQFYGSNNQLLVDLDNCNNYFKIVGKHEMGLTEFLSNSGINRLYPSNSLANVPPSLRVTEGADGNSASSNYIEPAYFFPGFHNTEVMYTVQLPLRFFKNTLFSVNNNFYFNQIMYLKVFWGPYTKIAFQSDRNDDPMAGNPVPYNPGNNAPQCQIKNLQLMVATEKDDIERRRAMDQIIGQNAPGLSMIIPYAYNYKNPNSGTTQNINIQMDIGSGKTLMRVYHVPFNNTEAGNTMFDSSNLLIGAAASEKVNNYWTNINGSRIQTITIDTTFNGFNTDYMNMKNSLKGSVLENIDIFKYNWHHMDDFSDFKNEYLFDDGNFLISGYPLGPTPITWTFVGNNISNLNGQPQALNHYTWAIFTKLLKITATGPIIE